MIIRALFNMYFIYNKFNCSKIILLICIFSLSFNSQAQISSFPYVENFESGPGGWTSEGLNNSWELGLPNAFTINFPASGSNAWVTNLNGNYSPDEQSILISPTFDITSLSNPTLDFNILWESEFTWDGLVVQYSTNNQVSWTTLGTVGSGTNWYNATYIDSQPGGQVEGWSGRFSNGNGPNDWIVASHPLNGLSGNLSNIVFRFVFESDDIIHYEGFGIDDVRIYDPPCNGGNIIIQQAQNVVEQAVLFDDYGFTMQNWIFNNGGAIASSDCGPITWSNSYNFYSIDGNLIYDFDFIATDQNGFQEVSSATFTVQGLDFYSQDTYVINDAICDDVFDLNAAITSIESDADLTQPGVLYSFIREPNSLPNEGPFGATFDNVFVDFPDAGVGSYSYWFGIRVDELIMRYEPISTGYLPFYLSDNALIEINDKTVAFEVEDLQDVSVCPGTFSTIQDLTDLLVLTPDPNVLPPQNPIDLNQYWTPSVYTDVTTTYTFDPSVLFPQCPTDPVSITVTVIDSNLSIPIPDSEFEQYLIDDGIDSNPIPDSQILGSDVCGVTAFDIDGYNIASFEGLQSFSDLISFRMVNNTAVTTMDFSGNPELNDIFIVFAQNLTSLDISQNENLTQIDFTPLNTNFSTIDLSGNPNLDVLRMTSCGLSEIDLTNNLQLSNLNVGQNPISELDVSFLPFLVSLSVFQTDIEFLDLSANSNLFYFEASNSNLKALRLDNGNNTNMTYVNLVDSPDLGCVYVDDPSFSFSSPNWNQDPWTTYIDEFSVQFIDTEPQDDEVQDDGFGNQAAVEAWFASHGNASDSNFCGGITWTYTYNVVTNQFFDNDTDTFKTNIEYRTIFEAVDVFGNSEAYLVDFTITGVSHFNEPFYGRGDTVCDDTLNLNTVITNIDSGASITGSSITNYNFFYDDGPVGSTFNNTTVDFPDTGAGNYFYRYRVEIEKQVPLYRPELGFIDGIEIEDETFITINEKTVAFDVSLPNDLQICPDDGQVNSIQDLTDLLIISPDPDVLEPQNPVDLNQYWTPNTFGGPGTYVFDPTPAFPNCPTNAVSITIPSPIEIIEFPFELIVIYNDPQNETLINDWLNTNGGAQVSGCGALTWSYDLDFNYIDFESLICEIEFTVNDEYGNQESFLSNLIFENFPIAGETDQEPGVICDSTYDLNGVNGINFFSPLYDDSIVSLSGDGTINGLTVDFPDTGAGSFSYGYSINVTTPVTIGDISFNVDDSAGWFLENVTVPFNPGEDKTVAECDLLEQIDPSPITLSTLFAQLDVIDGTSDSSFNPDNYWFDDMGNTVNQYNGPGVYTFNAGEFLPQCGGIPTTVTVTACNLQLSPRVMLQGASINPFVGEENLMRDNLRANGLIPTTSPYTDNLTCDSSVFNVTGSDAIIDWIWVELRDSGNSSNIVFSRSALLQRDGDVVDVDGLSVLTIDLDEGSYYVALNHRNHLGIMSGNAIDLSSTNTVVDFTNGSLLTFGMNAQTSFNMPAGMVGMWSGDGSNDDIVQYSGAQPESVQLLSYVLNDPTNFLALPTFAIFAYSNTDVNMDGITQYAGGQSDMPVILQNVLQNPANFLNLITFPIEAQLPENTGRVMLLRTQFENTIENDN